MDLRVKHLDSALAVTVSGRLDTPGAPLFEARTADILLGTHMEAMVLDLSECDYVSSAGLRAVVAAGRLAKRLGVGLAFCGLSPDIREVFDISGMLPLFPVEDSLDKALEAARA